MEGLCGGGLVASKFAHYSDNLSSNLAKASSLYQTVKKNWLGLTNQLVQKFCKTNMKYYWRKLETIQYTSSASKIERVRVQKTLASTLVTYICTNVAENILVVSDSKSFLCSFSLNLVQLHKISQVQLILLKLSVKS